MIALDGERAGRALGLAPLPAPVTGISIDSRTLRPGDLFVALRGECFDGHDYVEAAFAAGASAAVVERSARSEAGSGEVTAGGPVYQVDDSRAALWALAREVRRASGVTVFAVTGSVGKTSTKDLLKAMVGKARRVVATAGNQNNEVGVPLTLVSIEPDTEAVIVEMGMRGRGQIDALARVAEPDIGVITNIHPVHLELLGTIEAVAEAKAELIAGVGPAGVAVVPADCGLLSGYCASAACRTVRFGIGGDAAEADVRGWVEESGGRSLWTLQWPEGEVEVETPYMPRHRLENAVAAAAACYAAGLPMGLCVQGIVDARFTEGRGDVFEVGGVCIIDDTYNANPAAVRAAVDSLVSLARERGGRPVAVLGDMLELGPDAPRFHTETGAYAAAAGVRALWGVGPLSEATVQGFRRAWERMTVLADDGVAQPATGWAAGHLPSAEETSTVLAGLRPGDVVLLKASRSLRLERMVAALVGEIERETES